MSAKKKEIQESAKARAKSHPIEKQEPAPSAPDNAVADPLAQMMRFYDAFSQSWSKTMSDAVASKSFAEAMGRQVESGLDAMTLWRRQVGEIFEQYLQQMSLPTRSQIISLAERLTSIEMNLDDLHAKLDEALDQLKSRDA